MSTVIEPRSDQRAVQPVEGWIRPSEIIEQLTGGDVAKALSPTIRMRVVRKDDVGEVLVKIIQIFVVSFVAILYLIAPRPTDVGMLSSPTPYVLGAYLVLTFAGLLWALRPPVPTIAVYASIALDFILLYALIWSFHRQYGQPPSFVLKSPTLLYVFLFIALRTLRFEVRFVIAAGAMAAIGWLFILAWVLIADSEHAVITRNYVTYLTSNSVLLGAEIDKILLIIMVTAVLALSLMLAKRLLVSSISEAQAAGNLSRFFDPAVASDIREQDSDIAPGDGDIRHASILNVDLRGFTTLAAGKPPGEVIGALAEVQAALVPIIRGHGGTIDKFMGDGIMATFGAVRPSQTHAADAVACAMAVVDGFADFVLANGKRTWFTPEGIGASVVAGQIISGVVGVEGRLEFTVIGSAVNLSAKLEKHNKVAGTLALTTAPTLDLALRQGLAPSVEAKALMAELPGVAEPVEIVVLRPGRVAGNGVPRAGSEGGAAPATTPATDG
ncbi:MAG: adenylate/guanylate cyclase domain-containing protein [Rhizobiaceae bacterium]|nr:adenylate/guanylate cyclase domain-containing protein [Rhizobiaceae bacterium]